MKAPKYPRTIRDASMAETVGIPWTSRSIPIVCGGAGPLSIRLAPIRHQFEMAMMEVRGTVMKATASLGIASTDAFGYELDTLMRRADMAVYAAKRAGRNRVAVATAGEAEAAMARVSGEVVTAT